MFHPPLQAPLVPLQLRLAREQRERDAAAAGAAPQAAVVRREPPPEPLVSLVEYSWTQHHAEVEVTATLGPGVRKQDLTVEASPGPHRTRAAPPCRRPSGDRAGRHPRRLHRPPPAARRARCP